MEIKKELNATYARVWINQDGEELFKIDIYNQPIDWTKDKSKTEWIINWAGCGSQNTSNATKFSILLAEAINWAEALNKQNK